MGNAAQQSGRRHQYSAEDHVGKIESLGLVSKTDSSLNYVGLPEETTQWNENYTLEDYKKIVADIFDEKIIISDAVEQFPKLNHYINKLKIVQEKNMLIKLMQFFRIQVPFLIRE